MANFSTSTAGVLDIGGKFAADVNDTGGNIATGVMDTGGKFATFPNGILSVLGETDSWKKPEVENLVTLSL